MSKAFCGGADFVMMGGQFAGHDENPGEIIEEAGQYFPNVVVAEDFMKIKL